MRITYLHQYFNTPEMSGGPDLMKWQDGRKKEARRAAVWGWPGRGVDCGGSCEQERVKNYLP